MRHLLERFRASQVDVDSDEARIAKLHYTAHDAESLGHVGSTLAQHNSKESRGEMWTRLKLKHPGFVEDASEPAAKGPLKIGTLTAEHPSKCLWVDRNEHVHVLAHLKGLKESATIRDVAEAMGAGCTGEQCKGLSRLAEECAGEMHAFPTCCAVSL